MLYFSIYRPTEWLISTCTQPGAGYTVCIHVVCFFPPWFLSPRRVKYLDVRALSLAHRQSLMPLYKNRGRMWRKKQGKPLRHASLISMGLSHHCFIWQLAKLREMSFTTSGVFVRNNTGRVPANWLLLTGNYEAMLNMMADNSVTVLDYLQNKFYKHKYQCLVWHIRAFYFVIGITELWHRINGWFSGSVGWIRYLPVPCRDFSINSTPVNYLRYQQTTVSL